MANTIIHRRVEACQQGNFPQVICRLPSGWAVMGDSQFLAGYSLLYPDPVVPHLNAFATAAQRDLFLRDMAMLGEAVLAVTQAVRINYEMLGNLEPALHAHVFPRFDSESETLRTKPVWFYDWEKARKFDPEQDATMQSKIREVLIKKYQELGIQLPMQK